jgi:hypothetical protein
MRANVESRRENFCNESGECFRTALDNRRNSPVTWAILFLRWQQNLQKGLSGSGSRGQTRCGTASRFWPWRRKCLREQGPTRAWTRSHGLPTWERGRCRLRGGKASDRARAEHDGGRSVEGVREIARARRGRDPSPGETRDRERRCADGPDPMDLLRALIGVSSVATAPDWPQSARRLVDILIAGSRPAKTK